MPINWFPKDNHKPYPLVSGPVTGTGIYEIRETGSGRFSVYRMHADGNEHLGVTKTLDLAKQRAQETHDARLEKRAKEGRHHEYRIMFSGTDGERSRNETGYADTGAGAQDMRDDFLTRQGWRGDVTISRWNGYRGQYE